MAFPKKVTVVEVSPRDGLENLERDIPVEFRVELIKRLVKAGLTVIEAGAFVSPQAIPPMKNTADVLKQIPQDKSIRYITLVPNMHGFQDALTASAKEITLFTGATNSFTQANIHCTIEESLARFRLILEEAKRHNIPVRGGLSVVIRCPYEGEVNPESVATTAKKLWDMGCHEICLGDSNGFGTPNKVKKLISACIQKNIPVEKISLHFHNTYGQALANIYAGLELGVSTVESSIAGLGGCPNAPGATGNIATEDLVYMLNGMGIETHIDLDALIQIGKFACEYLKKPIDSKVSLAMQKGTCISTNSRTGR